MRNSASIGDIGFMVLDPIPFASATPRGKSSPPY
jgi:hypothetical protein